MTTKSAEQREVRQSVLQLHELKPGIYRLQLFNKEDCGEIAQAEDGYYKYWPKLDPGYWDEDVLFLIAHKLKELNASWHAQVTAYHAEEGNKDEH